MPKTSNTEKLTMILTDLLDILRNLLPATPFLDAGTDLNEAIRNLENLLNLPTKPHQPTLPPLLAILPTTPSLTQSPTPNPTPSPAPTATAPADPPPTPALSAQR